MVSRAIKSAQTQVEQQNMEQRKNVLKYDEVMNEQRKVIYAERRRVLEGEDLREQMANMLVDVVTAYAQGATADGYAEDWDHEKLWIALKQLYPVSVTWDSLVEEEEDLSPEFLTETLLNDAHDAYERREADVEAVGGEEAMRQVERQVLLYVLDRKWREHLYEMDYLKEGIGLRAMAQRDPLIEYQREGFDMFNAMLESLREEAVALLFHAQFEQPVQAEPQPVQDPAAAVLAAGRHAMPAPPQQPVPTGPPPEPAPEPVPAALRGKGLSGEAPSGLTYSGPAEQGGVQSRRTASAGGAAKAGDAAGSTRRERRAAARAQDKAVKKSKKGQ
ncbi:MAG TPA: preprotein translocase subunit SecA, partial [Amycolatopsis sp.]|nr:preprotein translocase subunit SecA [Amycolatopsis sp.]